MRATEVANKYKVHRVTVIRWIKSGNLKSTLVKPEWGGHWYYDITEEDLQEYLKKCGDCGN